jgi:hypothetical protein
MYTQFKDTDAHRMMTLDRSSTADPLIQTRVSATHIKYLSSRDEYLARAFVQYAGKHGGPRLKAAWRKAKQIRDFDPDPIKRAQYWSDAEFAEKIEPMIEEWLKLGPG